MTGKAANACGLYDRSRNAAEWTDDGYAEDDDKLPARGGGLSAMEAVG